jgi:hypothetical protein
MPGDTPVVGDKYQRLSVDPNGDEFRTPSNPADSSGHGAEAEPVPEAAAAMRAYLDERVDNLARSLDGDDAQLRA